MNGFPTFPNSPKMTGSMALSRWGVLILLLTLVSCRGPIVTVIPTDWELFHETRDGTDYYYNMNLMRFHAGDTVEVWVKIFVCDNDRLRIMEGMTKDQYAGSGWQKWSHNICLLELDCINRHLRWIQFTYYDNVGNTLYTSSSERKGAWESIEPDSMGANLQKKICKAGNRK